MKNALGHVLSAAVLVSSFGASIPAFADEASDNHADPVPALVVMGIEAGGDTAEVYSKPIFAADAESSSCESVSPRHVDFSSDAGSVSPIDNARSYISSNVKRVSSESVNHSYMRVSKKKNNAPSSAAEASVKSELKKEAEASENAAAAAKTNSEKAAAVADALMGEGFNTLSEASAENNDSEQKSEELSKEDEGTSAEKSEGAAVSEGSDKEAEASSEDEKTDAVKDSENSKESSDAEAPVSSVAAPVFSGTVESISENALSVAGTGSDGEPLSLDFIIDSGSQLAEGIKIGDSLTVFYEVSESGGYRVTSARYQSGTAPKNLFPGDIPEKDSLKSDPIISDTEKQDSDNQEQADADMPKVVGIEVEGNKTVSSEEILQIISTRIGDPLLEPRIRRDMQAIYDSGYYTDVRLDTRYTSDGVRIIFRVLENPVVNEIEFTGNNIVESDKIRSLMQMETGKVLNTRTLQNDLQAINKYYNEDLGYTISPSHVTKLDFTDGKLTLTLTDGIVVKEVKVEGVTVFPQDQIAAMIRLKPGDLFNRNSLREDTEKISELYEQKEYILDTIKPSVDVESGVVTVSVVEAVLQEVKLHWADAAHRTKDDTVMRNLRTKPGEVMRRDRIQKDLERLNNLGLFKKVEPEVEPGSAPGQAVLVLNIEEQKTGLATIGVGYAGGGSGAVRPGITGAVSYSERNLFGEGKQISVNLQRGAQIGSYGISYYDPAINSAQDSLGISVYYNSVDELEQQVTGAESGTYAYYDQEAYGATVTYGHPFSDDLRGFITLRHETINSKMSGKSLYVPVGIGKGDLNAIGVSALYDTRDDVFSPHKGTYGSASFTYAGLGGDYKYNKLVVEGRHYIPVTKRSTLALRGMYGTVGNGAPASEFFYAGGTDTLRGYQDNVFFGNKVVLLNAEYRFPIADIKMISGAVFVDAGNAWITGISRNKLHTDAGVGLRIIFPNLGLGVIRIDYAVGEDGSRASIGIGQSF